jgi:hypothetical protein
MASFTHSTLFIFMLVPGLAAMPSAAPAQTPPVVTIDDGGRSIADVIAAVSIQGPPDVNQQPVCAQLALPCLSGRTVPDGGLALSVAIFPKDLIGIVGEVSVYYNEWFTHASNGGCPLIGGTPQGCYASQTNHVRASLGGIRVRSGVLHDRASRVRLFGQALVGPQWSDVGRLQHVFQPGAGIDTYLSRGPVVHFEYDYRFVPDKSQRNLSTSRFMIGIGIPIGAI